MKKREAKQEIPFVKLEGAGNTLLLVESGFFPKRNAKNFVRTITAQGLGLDSDQLIEVVSWRQPEIRVWNRDGSRAEMCSNGTRVFLAWAKASGKFRPKGRKVSVRVEGKDYGAMDYGREFGLSLPFPKIGPRENLKARGKRVFFTPVSVGNPHAVVHLGKDIALSPGKEEWKEWGAALEVHHRFPQRTNVEFVGPIGVQGGRGKVRVFAWERGAGATLSCGSGAVAVGAWLYQRTGVNKWTVQMTSYELKVRLDSEGAELRGPWRWIASGVFHWE
jgi:diaminopimelate epimerase